MKHADRSLETRLRSMMACYPTLFGRREQALHHLYLVLGNGYEWRNGRLVGYDDPPVTKPLPEPSFDDWRKNHIAEWEAKDRREEEHRRAREARETPEERARDHEEFEQWYAELMAEHKRRQATLTEEERAEEARKAEEEYEKSKRRWPDDISGRCDAMVESAKVLGLFPYPYSQWLKVAEVPDNVKLDYLDGAMEAIEQALTLTKDEEDRVSFEELRESLRVRFPGRVR